MQTIQLLAFPCDDDARVLQCENRSCNTGDISSTKLLHPVACSTWKLIEISGEKCHEHVRRNCVICEHIYARRETQLRRKMQGQITALPSSRPGFGHPPVRFSVHIINIQASDSELLPKMNKIRVKDYVGLRGNWVTYWHHSDSGPCSGCTTLATLKIDWWIDWLTVKYRSHSA